MIYLIGSLRNPEVPKIASSLRELGYEVFDDWYAAGELADDSWREYEIARGRTYMEALAGAAAKNVFSFDKRHLESADAVILVLPAGKSGHLELGWAIGRGKLGYILLDSPDRWDVMYQFATLVTDKLEDIHESLEQAPQRLSTGSSICGATNGLGQPFRIEPKTKGQGSSGSSPEIPGISTTTPGFSYCGEETISR